MSNDTLSDEAIEAFFVGTPHPGWERQEPMVALADHMAVALAGPVPSPDHALLQLIWGNATATATAAEPAGAVEQPSHLGAGAAGRHGPAIVGPRRRLRLLAGAAAATTMAVLGVGVAGAAGVLPAPVQRVAARVVEAVSPFELPEPSPVHSGPSSGDGAADPAPGGPLSTDGGQTPGPTPGAQPEHLGDLPPAPPAQPVPVTPPGAAGLDTARQTPAGNAIPPQLPGPSGGEPPAGAGPPAGSGVDRAPQAPAGTPVAPPVPASPGSPAPGRP